MKDVTDLVDFGNSEDEYLPMLKCICGQKFGMWEHSISIYKDDAVECPNCGKRLFFRSSIKVYQVEE